MILPCHLSSVIVTCILLLLVCSKFLSKTIIILLSWLSFTSWQSVIKELSPLQRLPWGRGRTKRKGTKSARGGRWEEGKGALLSFSLPNVPRALAFSLSLQPPCALYFTLPNLPYSLLSQEASAEERDQEARKYSVCTGILAWEAIHWTSFFPFCCHFLPYAPI